MFFVSQLRFLYQDFRDFVRKDFNYITYLYVIVFIGLSIFCIYGTDIGSRISDDRLPTTNKLFNSIAVFIGIYFSVIIPVLLIKRQYEKLRNPLFYLKGLLMMSLIGFTDVFSWDTLLDFTQCTSRERSFIFKVLWRCRNVMFVLPVLILLRLTIDKNVPGLYGICRGNHHIKAYLSLY